MEVLYHIRSFSCWDSPRNKGPRPSYMVVNSNPSDPEISIQHLEDEREHDMEKGLIQHIPSDNLT